MTALQLSMMLSGLDDNKIVVKYNDKFYDIKDIEIGIDENKGQTFINIVEDENAES